MGFSPGSGKRVRPDRAPDLGCEHPKCGPELGVSGDGDGSGPLVSPDGWGPCAGVQSSVLKIGEYAIGLRANPL